MAKLESEVTITRPVEDVFRFLLDLDKNHSDPTAESVVKTPDGPTSSGTTFRFTHSKGPRETSMQSIAPLQEGGQVLVCTSWRDIPGPCRGDSRRSHLVLNRQPCRLREAHQVTCGRTSGWSRPQAASQRQYAVGTKRVLGRRSDKAPDPPLQWTGLRPEVERQYRYADEELLWP